MEQLTFHQQVIMGLIHGGIPAMASITATIVIYLKLRSNADAHKEQIIVQLNGSLDSKIKKAVSDAAIIATEEAASIAGKYESRS